MEIRPCTHAEVPLLRQLCINVFIETYSHLNTPENVALYLKEAYDRVVLERELQEKDSCTYLLWEDGELLGYLKLNWGDAQTEKELPDALEIQRIYLLQKAQGKGLGGKLLEFSVEEAKKRGISVIWCGVWEKNLPAVEFYKRKGFVRFSEHSFVVGKETQTDWMMKLLINR